MTAEDGGALTVTGSTPADVGRQAFAAGIELHELRSRTSGLEEIYFQLTAGQEQFAAPSPGTDHRRGDRTMTRLVRAEWTKLFTTRVWLGLLLGACVMVGRRSPRC